MARPCRRCRAARPGSSTDTLGRLLTRTWARRDGSGNRITTSHGYDNAGNRVQTLAGGDAAGGQLRAAAYVANGLNQYTQRSVPGTVDVVGEAEASATVTVNKQGTYRRGGYFQGSLRLENATSAVWADVEVVGVRAGAGAGGADVVTRRTGHVYVVAANEVYTYDEDANLQSDGRWSYTWNGENQLVAVTSLPGVPNGAKRRVEMDYDGMGRRVRKRVYGWNATTAAWVVETTRRYVHDGYTAVAELDGTNAVVRSTVWGTDVSGSEQGAGGIGGLVMETAEGTTWRAVADGVGNVTRLLGAGGEERFDYGPYGEEIGTGWGAGSGHRRRYSTKEVDAETGLVNFGFRYYDSRTGRWTNRDPIGEPGALTLFDAARHQSFSSGLSSESNTYGFVGNSAPNDVDPLGLSPSVRAQQEALLGRNYLGPEDHIRRARLGADIVQLLLDLVAASETPGWSQAAGEINAVISVCRDDPLGYTLSIGGIPPFVGVAPDLTNAGRRFTALVRGRGRSATQRLAVEELTHNADYLSRRASAVSRTDEGGGTRLLGPAGDAGGHKLHDSRGFLYQDPASVAHLRSSELQRIVPADSQGRVTMPAAVIEDAAGIRRVVIGTSERNGYLRPGVSIHPWEEIFPGLEHAERDIVREARKRGYKVIAVGAGRPHCPACVEAILEAGGMTASPRRCEGSFYRAN